MTSGTATLYGRFAPSSTVRRRARRAQSMRIASAHDADGGDAAVDLGERAAATPGRTRPRGRCGAGRRQRDRERPSPAPTSTTRSPGPAPASAAIARARLGSIRKCWPSAFVGRMPWRAASSRMRRPRGRATPRRSALPAEADVEDAAAERGEDGERLGREVDDAAGREGSTVIDHDDNRLSRSPRSVTVTRVPNGSQGCAAVSPDHGGSYHVACPPAS